MANDELQAGHNAFEILPFEHHSKPIYTHCIFMGVVVFDEHRRRGLEKGDWLSELLLDNLNQQAPFLQFDEGAE